MNVEYQVDPVFILPRSLEEGLNNNVHRDIDKIFEKSDMIIMLIFSVIVYIPRKYMDFTNWRSFILKRLLCMFYYITFFTKNIAYFLTHIVRN